MNTYSDFFEIDPGYKPVMTAEEINKEPETWLNFYPHPTFVNILRTLINKFENGDRSLWIYGAYGTGKTHAALVIQKILSDDATRVDKFFEKCKNRIDEELIQEIQKWRKRRVLPVFEYGTENVTNTERFLVRIEKAISRTCYEQGLTIPIRGNLEELIDRVRQEGELFFEVRNSIADQLENLTCDINNYDDFKQAISNEKYADGILQDARIVLEKRHIFISPSAEDLIEWIEKIIEANQLSKILFLWDEFTDYVNNCRSDLKAFEKMAEEKAQLCGFHFVPITHSHINAYYATGSESAKKASDRYTQCQLEIPSNTVFALGHDALKIKKGRKDEWRRELDRLTSGIDCVVTQHMQEHLPEVTLV